jgi:uncharacterized protein (DUF2132 family)
VTDTWARERVDKLLMSILLRSSRGQQRDALEAALREAEQHILARLREPDDAMIEAAWQAFVKPHGYRAAIKDALTAAAAFLSSPQEEG